jgi:hypothetical protein
MTRTLALFLAAALSAPAAATAQTTPKAPSGKYKVVFHGTGSVRVKDKKVISAAVIPKDDDTACGTDKITLKGTPYKLSIATRGGYRRWIVGKNAPSSSDGYNLIKAKFLFGGKTVSGKVKMLWNDDPAKTGSGVFAIGGCELDFSFQK